jgi:hypothetical protein
MEVAIDIVYVFNDVVANNFVVPVVVGLPDGVKDNVDYCGTDVDAINANAHAEAATTSTTAGGPSFATISDAIVVDVAPVDVSDAIATVAASTKPYFDMSQEVIDNIAEDGVQKEYRPVDVFINLYDDDDNDSLPSNVDDNDRSCILDREDFIEEENNMPSFLENIMQGAFNLSVRS